MFFVDGLPADVAPPALALLATTPCVVVGRAGWDTAGDDALELVDAVAEDDESALAITETTTTAPRASAALALHLRGARHRTTADGLVAESALYSSLQAGPEFAAWRERTPRRERPAQPGPAVVITRIDNELSIELARPERRNALNVQMRDEWLDALAVAEADPDLRVTITGQGPAFSAGGDLDEFGTFPDPATAHAVRLERSVGAALARLADRVTFHVHGACYGSGIELPAFAHRVVADPETTMALPELGLGLVPGAGGTTSLPARIGRHRTMGLALTRLPIDAATALAWGLVDEIAPRHPGRPSP